MSDSMIMIDLCGVGIYIQAIINGSICVSAITSIKESFTSLYSVMSYRFKACADQDKHAVQNRAKYLDKGRLTMSGEESD